MTFEELGATLRQEREKRHLSIEDVANQLKINPRLLNALETGDGRALPHPAYARGFIRSYASYLGFGQDEIQQWLAELQPEDLKKAKPAEAPAPAPEPGIQDTQKIEFDPPAQRQRGGAGKALTAVLLLCILAGGGYWLWQSGRLPFLESKKEEPADIINKLPSADTYNPRQATLPAREEEPQTVLAPILKPEAPEQASKPAADTPASPQAEPEQPESAIDSTDPEPVAQQAEAQIEPHKLVITAIEECWVHSTADKTDTRQFSLRKGDTFALTFADVLELKLGNAGGVRLRYDGNDMPPPGTSGQVRTLTFPPKND